MLFTPPPKDEASSRDTQLWVNTSISDKHCRCIGGALGTHLVFKVAFFALEDGLPLVPLLHLHLVVSIPEIDFCKPFGHVQAVQHLWDEREGEAFFHGDSVEGAVVHHEAQLLVSPLDEHYCSSRGRLRRADEAIGLVLGPLPIGTSASLVSAPIPH